MYYYFTCKTFQNRTQFLFQLLLWACVKKNEGHIQAISAEQWWTHECALGRGLVKLPTNQALGFALRGGDKTFEGACLYDKKNEKASVGNSVFSRLLSSLGSLAWLGISKVPNPPMLLRPHAPIPYPVLLVTTRLITDYLARQIEPDQGEILRWGCPLGAMKANYASAENR